MKLLLILLIFTNTNTEISNLRNLYQLASSNESKLNELIDVAKKNSTSSSLYKGYYGAGKIILAKYAFNPYTKWNLFVEGKEILESAIASDSKNLELRYLRLTIQMNAPDILGYKTNISNDKDYLTKHINSINDAELQRIIKNYLNSIGQ